MRRYLPAAAVVAYLLLAYREKGFLKGLVWPLKPFRDRKPGARSFCIALTRVAAQYIPGIFLVAFALWGAEVVSPNSFLIRSAVSALLMIVGAFLLPIVSYPVVLILTFIFAIIWKE